MSQNNRTYMGIRHFTEDNSPCRVSVSHFAIREIFMGCSRVICPKCRMVLKDRNGKQGVISSYYEPPTFGAQWAADRLKDKLNKVAYAEFVAVFGEPMIYRHPNVTPLVEIVNIEADDDHDADEPPMVPDFLANMTDEKRQAFVARFNSARVTSVEPIGDNGALVGYELATGDGQDVGIEPGVFVALDVRPYLDNEGKVSR